MQPARSPESVDFGLSPRSRSTSMSSDSQLPRISLFAPPPVNPPPAFIASSAASQIVTADQEFNTADFVTEDEPNGASAAALVTPPALALLNGFLDHILFNILAAAKSTQLAAIRPAVAEVLKPRLAKEVVSAADDELSEYMGTSEEEEEFRSGQEPSGEFDLTRSWKFTRLRCMVYTRLGDMEEDDEDEYIAQEGLLDGDTVSRRFTSHVGNITPAAAIFLTSIVEYLGEQGLVIAGETARSRLVARLSNGEHDEVTESGTERGRMNRLVVEDHDMEKLGLNSTLGRLWRTWRKRLRPTTLTRPVSRESFFRRNLATPTLAGSRKNSIATVDETLPLTVEEEPIVDAADEVDPASIPLPTSEHDVKEIEIPGFNVDMEGEVQTMEAMVAHKVRPRSLMVLCSPTTPRSTSFSSPTTPVDQFKSLRHARSHSMPNTPYEVQDSPDTDSTAVEVSPTSSEERRRLETMYEDDEPVDMESAETEIGVAITKTESDPEGVVRKKPVVIRIPEGKKRGHGLVKEVTISPRSPRRADAPVKIATGQISRAQTSPTPDDRQQQDAEEIFEGRGTCEKPPKLVTVQRPKRKSSRDPARREEDVSIPSSLASEPAVGTVVEDRHSTQGAYPPPSQAAVNEAIDDAAASTQPNDDVIPTVTAPPAPPQTFFSDNDDDEALPDKSMIQKPPATSEPPRPISASGDSTRSERSRTRPKPSPLSLVNTSAAGPGRSSPTVTSPATERAAVQRLPGRQPPSMASSINSKSRRSGSFGSSRDKRPVTAGSTASQVSTTNKWRGPANRPGDSTSLRVRSSSDTSRVSVDESGESADDDNKANLEKLIRSDETIHYTLTPKSMREMELPDSPRWKTSRSTTADLADFLKTTGPPGDEPPRPRTSKSSTRSGRGTMDLPPAAKAKPADSTRNRTMHAARKSISKARAGFAREAKPANASNRDFVDFLKSTGPEGGPPTSPRSVGESSSPRSRRLSDAMTSKKFGRSSNVLSNDAVAAQNRARLQARAAAPAKSEQTSDLIDFIREGPPDGAHRIPRHVAPFRNTMDSEELQQPYESSRRENGGGATPYRDSMASTQDGSMANKSLTSLGSRTGLLESSNRAAAAAAATQPIPRSQNYSASSSSDAFDDPMPVRKQRRVPDPYAIDYDDDYDDDDLEELLEPVKPKREEESLMDFLRNAPPPPPEAPPQPFAVNVAAYKNAGGAANAAAPAKKSRFLRSSSSTPPNKSAFRQQPPKTDISNYAVKVGQERGAPPAGPPAPAPAPTSQRQTETSALADFLKNTGPPEPPARAPPSSSLGGIKSKESATSLSKLFLRRKKVEV